MNPDWRKDYVRYRSFFLSMMSKYQERADIKAYLEILLSLGTVAIFTLFALRPTILTIAQLLKDIESKRQTLAIMDTKITNLAQAQSLYEQERSKIVLLESAIPKTSEPDIFSRQVEGLVGAHDINITSFTLEGGTILGSTIPKSTGTPAKDTLPEGAAETGFTLTGTTPIENYQKISSFLTDFEKLRRPVVINEIRITRGQEKDSQEIVLYLKGQLPYLSSQRNIGIN
jgi:hypothetical protein